MISRGSWFPIIYTDRCNGCLARALKRLLSVAILIFIFSSLVFGTVAACNNGGPALDGPAPNSGDGIPDGSGF
jgi:hypothetical protein